MKTWTSWGLAVAALLGIASGARAEVVVSASSGFEVRHQLDVARPPTQVWDGLSAVGKWWDPSHTFSGDATALSLDPRARGCFCETLDSGGVVHLVVIHAAPPKRLVLSGGLGPLQDLAVAGTMVWTFESLSEDEGDQQEEGTRVTLTYAVSGWRPEGLDSWAAPVDTVIGEQVQRFGRWLETESPDESP